LCDGTAIRAERLKLTQGASLGRSQTAGMVRSLISVSVKTSLCLPLRLL
jgi:hypothetical protein